MSNYAVIHIEKYKDVGRGLDIHLTRNGFTPDNADPSRRHLNRNLIDLNGKSIHDVAMARLNEAGIKLRNGQNLALEFILSGSTDAMLAMSEDTLKSWTNDSLDFVRRHCGYENVISAHLHRDETAPHLHVIVLPIVNGESRRTKRAHEADEGNQHKRYNKDVTRLRLSADEVLNPEKLNYYWDAYPAEVGSKYNLQRGVHAEKGSKVAHTDSTEYNRALERENRRIQTENAELTRKNGKLREESDELEKRIDSENKTLEIRAETAQLPKPDFLGRYKEEDVRQFLDDAAGRSIVTKRLAVTPAEKIRRLESEKGEIEEKLAEYEKILASPEKMRSRAAFLEFRKEVSASIECKYGIKGTLNYRGTIKDTPLSLFTLTVGSLRHIIVATPDGEAFRYPHVPALGAKGMERVASNAVHGTYDSGKGLNVHISNVARIAQILYPDKDRVRGNSWSGKSALSEEQRRQLRELERSGAANVSFEDTTYVEFLG